MPKYEVRVASRIPELFVIVWLEEGVPPIQSGVQMPEPELRAALRMNHGISDDDIDRTIAEARDRAA